MATAHRIPTHPRFIDLTGKTFGRLTVISYAGLDRHRKNHWNCICSCGGETRVRDFKLRSGYTKSCGCLQIEAAQASFTTHGCCRNQRPTPEYRIWMLMRNRCHNTTARDFARYGGRGITVCKRWRKFENFLADMGPRPSPKHQIERRDNDGNYEPGNCRWATRTEQARNKRNNHLITFNGTTLCISAWAEQLGMKPQTLATRIRAWGSNKALSTPAPKPQ